MIGVILLNLGGPDSHQAVKPFLYNLFSDREIIKLGPLFLQKPLAWLVSILRSPKTRKMYNLIGGKSPILDITLAQAKALEDLLNQETGLSFKVYVGMRYSPPFIKDTVDEIIKDGIKHLIVLPLYPHYSRATTGSAIAEFKRAVSGVKCQISGVRIQYIESWYDFPPYIEAIAELIYDGISGFTGDYLSPPSTTEDLMRRATEGAIGRVENVEILYSAHSLPKCLIDKGDPYLDHIKATVKAVNSLLLTRYSLLFKWHLSFQSKSGPVEWLEPSTDETIIRLAKEGCKNLFIVPISFVSDHIETLYEIDILYRGLAEKHGINFKRCQALNNSERFINAIKELIMMNIKTF